MADEQTLEQQVEMLQEQLRQAQKLTALGELVSTTTHEFNNVLMTIINYAKMGLRHKDDETRAKSFEKILAAGQRAARITNSVLGVARNRSGSFEPVELKQLVEDILVIMEREFSKYRISVETQFVDNAPAALANGNQLQQVVLNLLINARQAMSEGGTVLIKVSPSDDAGMVDLMIRDNGSGIPGDKLPRIFDQFFSTKSGPDATGKGGTGLGLAACREIIEAHEGRIRVESTVGVGTAFTIKLPIARPTSPTAPPLGTGQASQTGSVPAN